MFANPDIPNNYKSGSFHILQLGVFVVLEKHIGVTFSGRRLHMGTAPTPPPGCPSVPYAYRFNVVWYPKHASVDGRSRFTLASLPGKTGVPALRSRITKSRKAKVGKGQKGKEKDAKPLKGKAKAGNSQKSKRKPTTDNVERAPRAVRPSPLHITSEMINVE